MIEMKINNTNENKKMLANWYRDIILLLSSIKKIVERLQNDKRSEVENHRKVLRPWGYYDLVDSGEGFQVKRIFVNSGAKLSLQKHKYRSEHWVVVFGTATVIKGKNTFILQAGDSIYIPKEILHSLRNNTKVNLIIIEVQTGTYLGEDDIERFDDIYGRI